MRSKCISNLKLLFILVCLVHPPGLFQLDIDRQEDSQNNFMSKSSNNKIKVINTFVKEAAEPDFFQTAKTSIRKFIDTSVIYVIIIFKAADPILKHYYLHIILSILILAILIAVVKKNLEINKIKLANKKGKLEKNKSNSLSTPNPYYFNDSVSNSSEENTPICLTGRKTKKPKLDIDYGTVFKSNNKSKPEKNSIKSQLNLSNPFFEYANMVSDDEQFKNNYYSNDYIVNLQIKQTEIDTKNNILEKEAQNDLIKNIPNSEAIYIPYDYDKVSKPTEYVNRGANNTNREFDIFEVFEDKKISKSPNQETVVKTNKSENNDTNNNNTSLESFKFSNN